MWLEFGYLSDFIISFSLEQLFFFGRRFVELTMIVYFLMYLFAFIKVLSKSLVEKI